MEFKVHKFATKQEALNAIKVIDEDFGFSGNQTQTYAQPQQHGDIWYIDADKVTEKYLGKGEILTIENNDN